MISKHLLSICLLCAVAGSSLPVRVGAAVPTPPKLQSLAASAVTLVFQLQRVPRTAVSQNINTTMQVFKKRLTTLGYVDAVVTGSRNNVTVKIAGTANNIDTQSIANSLMTSSKLSFASQKTGTEELFLKLHQERSFIKNAIRELTTRSEPLAAPRKTYQKRLCSLDRQILRLFKSAEITDRHVIEAEVEYSNYAVNDDGVSGVIVKFDAVGTQRFTSLTKKIAGTGRSIGIFINDQLYSSPTVSAEYKVNGITGGTAQISGNFSKAEAESLALSLSSGQLPTPIKLLGIDNSSGN
jgi:preprotein translocase subunit SecD